LNVSAWVFTKATSVAVSFLHEQDIAVSAYIDDWLVHHPERLVAQQHRDQTLQCLLELGWHVNEHKSEFELTQQFRFLGVCFNTVSMTMTLPTDKVEALRSLILPISEGSMVTPRLVRSLIGHLSFAMHYVPFGKTNTRPFQWLLKTIWNWADGTLDVPYRIPLILGLEAACSRWLAPLWPYQGVSMHRRIQDFTLHTDASGVGWGATITSLSSSFSKTLAGRWSTAELPLHSNIKELVAVHQALLAAKLPTGLIQVYTDNTTVVAVLNRQGTIFSQPLQEAAFALFEFLQREGILVRAAHIPGILNLGADILSRPDTVYATEWSLDRSVFRWLCAKLNFQPKIDVFATSLNSQLPLYFSPVPDEKAAGLDAFNQNWDGWLIYVFPPFMLMSQVIQKLAVSRQVSALVIYPKQPRRAWYPVLMEIPHSTPVCLPIRKSLLRQPHNLATHPRLQVLNLHAAMFSVP
jgi:hypothetical protein